jgi:hypothetical protein
MWGPGQRHLDWNPPSPDRRQPADVYRANRIDVLDLIDVLVHWSKPF